MVAGWTIFGVYLKSRRNLQDLCLGHKDRGTLATHKPQRERMDTRMVAGWKMDCSYVSGNHGFIPGVKIEITTHIYKSDINGAHLVQLTDRGTNVGPAWSPDSQRIAFASYHRGDERKGIYVMDADGRRLRRI